MRLPILSLATLALAAALGGCVYPFDKDRWDYVYYFRHGRHRPQPERRLEVYFKDDKVTHFERINVPESAPMAPDEGAPISKFPKI